MDVLGLSLPKGKELQAIYAGYDGPRRIGLNTDAQMVEYYSRFTDAGGDRRKDTDNYDARRDPEMQHIIADLEKMRLGAILTKMQMSKYLRLLGEAKKDFRELEKDWKELSEK